jgi:mono/diheme cytochrome c family protein
MRRIVPAGAPAANRSRRQGGLLGSDQEHHGEVPMIGTRRRSLLLRAILLVAATLAAASSARAQAPDPADIAAGMRLFRQKGNCQACHGWAGDGRKMDSQMPDGANLRESVLDREVLILLIKCGRPGSGMPAFDKFAYSDGRCYGLKQADLKSPKLQMPDPPATLLAREIEAIADFMLAKIVGKGPMDRAKCIDYWGSDVEVCSEFAK